MKVKYKVVVYEHDEPDNPAYGRIKLGLCCMNNELREKNIFCSRTTTRDRFTIERAKELSLLNIRDIYPIIKYSDDHFINVFRLSSDIFPHFTDTETEPYDMLFAKDDLKLAGELCKIYEQRVTMHPGQYNQVGAKNKDTFEKTIADLSAHADILDYMDIDENGILTVHGGGTYGDKEATKRRWIEQFDDLPRKVKNRLVIENCEKGYSVRDCIDIATETGISVVFDSHHYECYNHFHKSETQEAPEDLVEEVLDTWKNRIPSFHISEQKEGAPTGAHSDYIANIPKFFLSIPELYNRDIHIDVEAKAKEKAIFRLYDSYPDIFPKLIN
jgi:UV DNA damage endonuclease